MQDPLDKDAEGMGPKCLVTLLASITLVARPGPSSLLHLPLAATFPAGLVEWVWRVQALKPRVPTWISAVAAAAASAEPSWVRVVVSCT